MQRTVIFEVGIGFTKLADVDDGSEVGGCDNVDFESEGLEGDLENTVNACEGEVEEGVAGRGDARALLQELTSQVMTFLNDARRV